MSTKVEAAATFQAGGTLDPTALIYVERPMDEQLRRTIQSGEYCNILTCRQMGKSSLMARTVYHLRKEGVCTAMLDLGEIGRELNAEQWYFGLISGLKRRLGLETDEQTWWQRRVQQGVAQRFADFLRDVVLEEISDPVLIAFDEIDATLSLPFTDDFFTVIRAAYNARATDPVYRRLTVVLLGVARPSDLIKDRSRTPYNIGRSIDLRDFTPEEAKKFLRGLKAISMEQAESILDRVLYWTDGHPYLTQWLCAAIVSRRQEGWSNGQIDTLIRDLFLVDRLHSETNIQYIHNRIQTNPNRTLLLQTYHQILTGKSVADEELDPVKSELKLSGLVKVTPDGRLVVRNRLYEQVFNRQWLIASLPWLSRIGMWLGDKFGE